MQASPTETVANYYSPDEQYAYDHLQGEYLDLEKAADAAQAAVNAALNAGAAKPERFLALVVDEFTPRAHALLEKPTVQLDLCGLAADSVGELADKLAMVVAELRKHS